MSPPGFARRAALFTLIFLTACSALGATPSFATIHPGADYAVVDNAPFATVVRGLPSALALEVGATKKPAALAATRSALWAAARPSQRARLSAARLLRAAGGLGRHTPLCKLDIVAGTRQGHLPTRLPAAKRILTTRSAPITFKYIGFSTQQLTDFSAFRDRAYPLMVALYGDPLPSQQGKLVTIQMDAGAGDGTYELPPSGSSTSGGVIRYAPLTSADGLTSDAALAVNNYNLSRLMLIAFHGADVIAFDGWERGFADAAALIVSYQDNPSPTFDPSQLGVYLLSVYDILNRPELGNPIFFANDTSPNMGFYRLGMAQAAWLKVWVENPNFFKLFNARYSALVQSDATAFGNTNLLKTAAAAIVPHVEGLGFFDWYRRQYVLDTSVTTGEKLWVGVVPQTNLTQGDTRSVFFGVVQHYSTDVNGSETPLTGQGTARAYDEAGFDISRKSAELFADNRVVFNALGEAEMNGQNVPTSQLPIIGFTDTGTPDRARITIDITVGSAEATALFPYGVIGTVAKPSGFYGATVGADSGTLAIRSNGLSTAAPQWQRGAFNTVSMYRTGAGLKNLFNFTFPGEPLRSVQRNSAWSYFDGIPQSLGVILQAHPGAATFGTTLTAPGAVGTTGGNRLRMISLPCYPAVSDEATVLGISPASLMLARYRPTLTPSGFSAAGIGFGIASPRHELYPSLSEPFAPGRGYWLKLDRPLTLAVRGSEPGTTLPFAVPLWGGWNQVGVPYNKPFALSAVRVQNGNAAPLSFATAQANGLVGAGIWRWNVDGGYSRVDNGTTANQQLQPYEGYYIFANQARGLHLLFDAGAAQSTALPTPANTAANWRLALTATTLEAHTEGSFGVSALISGSPGRVAAANAPAADSVVTLAFAGSGNAALDATRAGDAAGWADSFVPALTTPTTVWRFLVDGTTRGEHVTLSWGDSRMVPQAPVLTLVDEKSRARVSMNTFGKAPLNYVFKSEGAARQFHIEATAPPGGRTVIDTVTLSAGSLSGSRLVAIAATASASGIATLDIETPSGELVARLAGAQALSKGTTHWQWNGTSWLVTIRLGSIYVAHLTWQQKGAEPIEKKVAFTLS